MATELPEEENDDEMSQWAGGYVNAEGSIGVKAQSQEYGLGYTIKHRFTASSNVPGTAEMGGLVDGDGYIQFGVNSEEWGSLDYSFNEVFGMNMTTEYDIERFAKWFRSIGIEPRVRTEPSKADNAEKKHTVQVSDREDLEQALRAILPYLSKSKGIQAVIALEELLPRLNRGVHLEKRGFIECMSWVNLQRSFKGARSDDVTYDMEYFLEEWPNVEPRDSHMAPSKEEFQKRLGTQKRETFEEKNSSGPAPSNPDPDHCRDDDPFDI